MFKKLFTKKIFSAFIIVASLLSLTFSYTSNAFSASGRDNDSNALIYGGALSISELKSKVANGTGKPHQSGSELTSMFKTFGMDPKYFDKMQNGTVYKDGHVTVGTKTVARGVESAGREFMPGSTRDTRFSYPIYWRHPSVSFRSDSIPAFVMMNSDGTMAFAIVKSCGNAVKGVGVRENFTLTVKKFNDKNGDKKKDTNEEFLPNWQFKITGPNTNATIKTNSKGEIVLKHIKPGTYKIEEIQQNGWTNTTPLVQTVKLAKDTTVLFGNKKKEVEKTFSIKAIKFEDCNKNKKQDTDEKRLSGWQIKLEGNGISKEMTTNENGEVIFPGLKAGTYKLTETLQTGWENITPLEQTVTIPTNSSQTEFCVEFANFKKEIIKEKKFQIKAIKFEDCNKNKEQDGDEQRLADWEITLKGEGMEKTLTTNENGEAIFADLPAGTYTISETMQEGWENVTPISQSVTFEKDCNEEEKTVIFGNAKKNIVTPATIETEEKEVQTPAEEKVEAENLPTSGPVEAAAGTFGLSSIALATLYYKKAKNALKNSFRNFC